MDSHGRRFEAFIDMVELQGLLFPSELMEDIEVEIDIPIRQVILARVTEDKQPIFLFITKNGDPQIGKQHTLNNIRLFATCTAAWIVYKSDASSHNPLLKHFTPEAGEEDLQEDYDGAT